MTLALFKPDLGRLPGFTDAVERGWSPDNVRGPASCREILEKAERDLVAFIEALDDPRAGLRYRIDLAAPMRAAEKRVTARREFSPLTAGAMLLVALGGCAIYRPVPLGPAVNEVLAGPALAASSSGQRSIRSTSALGGIWGDSRDLTAPPPKARLPDQG